MHRSSEFDCRFGCCLGQGSSRTHQPGKDASRDHRDRRKPKLRAIFSLRAAVERTGNCAQDSGAARHRCHPNHRDRQRYRDGKLDYPFSPFFRRMDCLRLAGLQRCRPGHTPSDGGGPYLCAPLCSLHPRRHRRRGRYRCAGSRYSETSATIGTAGQFRRRYHRRGRTKLLFEDAGSRQRHYAQGSLACGPWSGSIAIPARSPARRVGCAWIR